MKKGKKMGKWDAARKARWMAARYPGKQKGAETNASATNSNDVADDSQETVAA